MEAHTVAVLNSADDVIAALRDALDEAGFRVVTAHVSEIQSGTLDLVAFVETYDPQVIVYDLPRPIERHWNFLRLVRSARCLRDRCWVLTTIDKAAVEAVIVPGVMSEIVLGEPRTLDHVVDAVRQCLTARIAV
jgi:hypothetical protein